MVVLSNNFARGGRPGGDKRGNAAQRRRVRAISSPYGVTVSSRRAFTVTRRLTFTRSRRTAFWRAIRTLVTTSFPLAGNATWRVG